MTDEVTIEGILGLKIFNKYSKTSFVLSKITIEEQKTLDLTNNNFFIYFVSYKVRILTVFSLKFKITTKFCSHRFNNALKIKLKVKNK